MRNRKLESRDIASLKNQQKSNSEVKAEIDREVVKEATSACRLDAASLANRLQYSAIG